MVNYETLMLRKACEELSLQCVFLQSRLDDLEASFEHMRKMVYSAAYEVGRASDNPEADPAPPSP